MYQFTSIKELLALCRKIKELWVFGPLGRGDPNARAKEDQIDRDVACVANLLNGREAAGLRELAERCGGTYEPLGTASAGAGAGATGVAAAAPAGGPAPAAAVASDRGTLTTSSSAKSGR